MKTFDVVEFAAQRRRYQDLAIDAIEMLASKWLVDPSEENRDRLLGEVRSVYQRTYRTDNGEGEPHAATVADTIASILSHSSPDTDSYTLATLLAINAMNAAAQQAADDNSEPILLEWVTMHDADVRPTHRDVDGERRPPGETWDVGGSALHYPGQPVGDPSVWINCRCTLAPVTADTARLGGPVNRTTSGGTMTITSTNTNGLQSFTTQVDAPAAEPTETTAPIVVPWHGVLAPEGKWSGDGRRFAENSLSTRDLPLPLTWQKTSDDGHKGSVTVAKIARVERVNGEMRGTGEFLTNPEADEVVGLLAAFGKFGVSVDADDTEFEFNEDTNQITFTSARIASASIVSIPAFAEAWVTLGPPPDDFMPATDLVAALVEAVDEFVSDKPWSDFTQADYTPTQWKSACVMHVADPETPMSNHKLPIKEPGGALNRNGVHAAAGRFNQTQGPAEAKAAAKARLRGAYKQLGEDPPDVLKADGSTADFGRGPGWVTHPIATKRIHDYWTVPGQEGYAKIGWGTPGDFDRCKVEIGQEIAEEDPEKVALYMNQICSQWHHDATGFWPGHAPAERAGSLGGEAAPALSLVAAGAVCAPAPWFANPNLTRPTHLTVADDGRVFGHIAEWGVCHIGFDGVCVVAPHSDSDYAYFATGQVLLDDGSTARTGVISLGGGHAGQGGLRATTAHYDSTSTAVADVAVGEDEHGIWCAGWMRPGTTDEQMVALRASDVSGDWREVGDQMEMIAALAVNVAGFPIARTENGRQVSLVAAGVVTEQPDDLDRIADRIVEKIESRQQAQEQRRVRMKELLDRVRKDH